MDQVIMPTLEDVPVGGSLLAALFSEETFVPALPASIEETGLSPTLVEALVVKYVGVVGSASGRQISDQVCLPFGTLEALFRNLRQRQILVHSASAQMNDYYYTLTDQGRQFAQRLMETCAYVGPAPVPLVDYVVSVEAQTIRAEAPKQSHLAKAFADISIEPELLDLLGPAINSGAGMFLYGAPGNGKTTLAARITMCFGQDIWIPRTLTEDGQLIKLYDAAYHRAESTNEKSLLKSTDHDRRWIKVRRPTVIVGGELTLDSLEIRHDPVSNVSEAPLQLKSNCGCLLVDDFGRQRIEPTDLLNRWIIPLENRQDFLTIATGKKIQVPFEQLIIFSTNLDPTDLTDEAFLRRIPYKIEVCDPTLQEFHRLFETLCRAFRCEYRAEVVDTLVQRHYQPYGRPLRRCHPRDLLAQIRNYCAYHDIPVEMTDEHFDRVVRSYFTALSGMGDKPVAVEAVAVPAVPSPARHGATESYDSSHRG
jgi:predicted ATPase with chaperone activity